MLIKYLIIPILLGTSVRDSATLKDLNSAANAADEETMRLVKSESIHKYMNESIDPCEDFYQFTCGNWRKHHPATIEMPETFGLNFCQQDFDRILIKLLNATDDKYTKSEWKVKNFYQSCLNFSSLKRSGYRQNMKKLINEFGRMPALEGKKWQDKKFDWIKTIGEISYKYNIRILFGHSMSDMDGDPTANMLTVGHELLLPFPDTSAETINKHKSDVEHRLKYALGLKSKTAKQTAKEIVDFAVKLWKATETSDKESVTTFAEMHQKYSRSLDVMKFMNASFGYIPDGVVIHENPSYVEALATLVRKTPKRVLANYIFYVLVHEFQSSLSSGKAILNEFCLDITKAHFLPILSNMVYRRSPLIETEQDLRRMWQGITKTLQNVLESNRLRWFDDDSREAALEKLYLMQLYIASFEEMNFDELYKDLTLNSSDCIENTKSIKSLNAKQTRKSLYERKNDKYDDIGDYTPSYMISANVVRFPMSSLVSDYMWSKNTPHAFNYGRLGSITAHEIMHGFSGHGRHVNKLGHYIDSIYKDIEDDYDERRQCYYDQYHNFTLDNKPLPQDESQGENVADNGGIHLAYHTYLTWLSDEARTQQELDMETLPHLNYTNKQLFFIGYSQLFCSDNYPVEQFERASDSVHSLSEFRAFVPLLNFGEFSKEFKCPRGSPMNPHKKCSMY